MSTNPGLGALTNCDCCEGIAQETPQAVTNRPGLPAIAYRVGTHQQFKASLLGRLSSSRQVALNALRTRQDDDFTIALLDAFSTVADVLTFYTERIANEAYLRTGTERRSVLELARLIGYRLQPGVAASTCLAFTIDSSPGAFGTALVPPTSAGVVPEAAPTVTINAGTQVQSIPGPDEKPQIFETVETIDARAEWNAIPPRSTQPQVISTTSKSFILAGAIPAMKKGDRILIADGKGGLVVRTVLNVTIRTIPGSVDPSASSTEIDLAPLVGGEPGYNPPTYTPPSGLLLGTITDFAGRTPLTADVVGKIISKQWESDTLLALARVQNWNVDELAADINLQLSNPAQVPNAGLWVYRQRAAAFGYNAPLWDSLQPNLRLPSVFPKADQSARSLSFSGSHTSKSAVLNSLASTAAPGSTPVVVPAAYPDSWENWDLTYNGTTCSGSQCSLYLDNSYPDIVAGSWITLQAPSGYSATVQVISNVEATFSAFTLSAKVSRLTLPASTPLSLFPMRGTTILCQSEPLPLAQVPIADGVQGNVITLDRAYLRLSANRKVVITGERSDLDGVTTAEIKTLQEVMIVNGFTIITLDTSLENPYKRSTVDISANVALSTNGASVQEILGSGDGSQTFQSFVLLQPPLTYVSAANPSGIESTLEVRADDLLWKEVPFFYGHGPEEHIYITRQGDYGKTTVTFGDGITGARLPTGQQNVKAKYRQGIGLGGMVRANQLSLLLNRPLGVKAASNPEAASGAADPEKLADARTNATFGIMTLGRIVSLEDYQDFARAFSGIAKAFATWTWSGQQRIVLLTIAGANGATVPRDSALYTNLLKAITQDSEPYVTVIMHSYEPIFFRLAGSVTVDSEHLVSDIQESIETTLRSTFSFAARDFGQPVHLSEVIAAIQNVDGVVDVDVDKLYRSDQQPYLNFHIAAAVPGPSTQQFTIAQMLANETLSAAQLLTLDPRPLDLEVTQ